MSNQDGIELRWIFAVIRRWLWLILSCSLLAAAVTYAVTSKMPPSYEAEVTLYIEPAKNSLENDYNVIIAGERLTLTYSQMLKGQPILDTVISKLGLKETPDELVKRITAEPAKDTQLINLKVADSSPLQAARIANALAETLIAHIQELQSVRYTDSLASIQKKMETTADLLENTQAKIDAQNTRKIEEEAELTRLENLLTEFRNDYRALQQSYQSMQINMAQVTDKVKIVEEAFQPETPVFALPAATVTILIDSSLIAGGGNSSSLLISQQLELTYGKMISERPILEAATTKLGVSMDLDELAKHIKVDSVAGTQLLRVRVEDEDASQAMLLANAIAETFIAQVRAQLVEPYSVRLTSLQKQIDDLSASIENTQTEIKTHTTENVKAQTELVSLESVQADNRNDYRSLQQDYEGMRLTAVQAANTVVITQPAREPDAPKQSQMLYIALAVMIGALIGFGIAFLLEYMNDTIRTPEDVSRLLGLGTLGTISHLARKDERLIVDAQPRSPAAEAFRILSTNIRFSGLDKPLQTLLVTSPQPMEGKSLVVANLSYAVAHSEKRVVAVDADLRVPSLHTIFGVAQNEGLTGSLLKGNIDGNLQSAGFEGLMVLPCGELPPNPTEAVGSMRMRQLLEELTHKADLVLLDCPPVLIVADTLNLASAVDGVLLVIRAGKTRAKVAREAVESLRKVGARIIGVVLNDVPGHRNNYYSQYKRNGNMKTSEKRGLQQLPQQNPQLLEKEVHGS